MNQDRRDVEQRLKILDILYADVLSLENEQLRCKLSRFRSENVQWILNILHDTFKELDYVLELEESNFID